jgi:hypothetical protein
LAQEWGLIGKVPKFKLAKEIGRSLLLDEEAERKILPFCGPTKTPAVDREVIPPTA